MTETRVLPLTGIHNFRDYGLYSVAGGGRVRPGLLWRSAQHGDATDADLSVVRDLGIGTVVDLRGNSERDAKPCRRYPGFAAEVLFHDGETAGCTCRPPPAIHPPPKPAPRCSACMKGSPSAPRWCR